MRYVIETGGKQYCVDSESNLNIEKLNIPEGGEVVFDKVLAVIDGDKIELGKPYLEGVTVTASVLKQGRSRKIIVFRYHSKTRYRKKKGHRQQFTQIAVK